jgi:Lrp/AsnC family transcriptional regulator for asnA, asnC and gidA
LQENGRLSFAKIAETLDVSEGTVRNRVNRMTEAKVLRIMAVADPLALGYTGYAMLAMRLGPNADPESVAKRFAKREEVTYVVLVAGRYDLLVEVICEDQKELRDFIFKHCYHHPDIASVEPMMALAMYKNLLKWGQP